MVTWVYPRGEFNSQQIEELLMKGQAHAVEVDVMAEIHVTYADKKDGRELLGTSGSMVGYETLTTMADLVAFRMDEARRSAEREWYVETSYAVLYHTRMIKLLVAQLRVANAISETHQQISRELAALEEAANQYEQASWYPS